MGDDLREPREEDPSGFSSLQEMEGGDPKHQIPKTKGRDVLPLNSHGSERRRGGSYKEKRPWGEERFHFRVEWGEGETVKRSPGGKGAPGDYIPFRGERG